MVTKDKQIFLAYNFRWGMIKPFAQETLVGDAGHNTVYECPGANRGEVSIPG